MANALELFKKTVPLLDKVYRAASLTSVLDGAPGNRGKGAGLWGGTHHGLVFQRQRRADKALGQGLGRLQALLDRILTIHGTGWAGANGRNRRPAAGWA